MERRDLERRFAKNGQRKLMDSMLVAGTLAFSETISAPKRLGDVESKFLMSWSIVGLARDTRLMKINPVGGLQGCTAHSASLVLSFVTVVLRTHASVSVSANDIGRTYL